MEHYEVIVSSTEETLNIAEQLGVHLKPSDVITLEGDLGAGKTTFTKGLAKGLEIKRTVNSPTFTIIKEYTNGRIPLYHMDVYRLADSDEDLGFDEYFHGDGVTVIEWAHLIEDQLPEHLLKVEITLLHDQKRKLRFIPIGKRYEELCKEFFNENISN
ncbi:tRNA (adenosine(37)-N6)-threonylcarbamoyltransferase complex ATPase subunit type 1 TsaE [Pallidibacillus pasinlerensis]|uniref:tRNA threonylcarbamoyladenosine biosynthesis protein TsaE n=1 Tax=Pallidibacillus pasinlerensis TaxID=2703818 RepID=A0ABX0A3W7_9BACI|nr:tRNA (adenosine(37)-N6)-threonylcarbamoyltransferase complex ATPase subunit type 1 TsaE [Pallidibacillus pasinlerensis]NCU16664.1 tRNA (adenosine(37)-N6)-threonylcarbamoyltransferase complex ATPase subunit type 1 TsaE [Pallidibacillus pasinlerensis]